MKNILYTIPSIIVVLSVLFVKDSVFGAYVDSYKKSHSMVVEHDSLSLITFNDSLSYGYGIAFGYMFRSEKFVDLNFDALSLGVKDKWENSPDLNHIDTRIIFRASEDSVKLKTLLSELKTANKKHLTDGKALLSYAVGTRAYPIVRTTIYHPAIGLNMSVFIMGMKHIMEEGQIVLMSEETRKRIMDRFYEEEQRKEDEKKMSFIKKNQALADSLFSENKKNSLIKTTNSGFQYLIIKKGKGRKPNIQDEVNISYTERFIDGKVVWSTEKEKLLGYSEWLEVDGPRLIKGIKQALILMPTGSKWKLFLPANLAHRDQYGENGITPGATVIVEIELKDTRKVVKPKLIKMQEAEEIIR